MRYVKDNKMKMNIFRGFLGLFLMVVLLVQMPLSVYAGGSSDLAIGNSQYYSVYLDAEGEAVVFAKLIVRNVDDEPIDSIVVEMPGDFRMLNVIQETTVIRERSNGYEYEDYLYYGVDYEVDGEFVVFNFEDVLEQEEAVLLVSYKLYDVASLDMGVYNFEFVTLKSDYDMAYSRVSINVDSGLYLAGVEKEVDYSYEIYGMIETDVASSSDAVSDEDIEDYSRSIERSSGIVKESYVLDPNETVIVSGRYSASEFMLNLWGNVLKIVFGGGLLVGIGVWLRSKYKKLSVKKDQKAEVISFGLASAVLLSIIIGGGSWIMSNLREWVGYQLDGQLAFFLGIVMFIASVALFVLPPIYVGRKYKDFLAGILTVAATIGFLVAFVILGVLFGTMFV